MDRKRFSELRREFAAKSVDDLLRLLESDELATRFVAEMCIRDATGT